MTKFDLFSITCRFLRDLTSNSGNYGMCRVEVPIQVALLVLHGFAALPYNAALECPM